MRVSGVAVDCGPCGNRTLMYVLANYQEEHEDVDDSTGQRWDAGIDYDLLLCPSCKKINLRLIEWHELVRDQPVDEGRNPEEVLGTIEYPPPREILPDCR